MVDKDCSCASTPSQASSSYDQGYNKINEYGPMSEKLHDLKMELCNMQQEKLNIMQQRKLLKCANPYFPSPCNEQTTSKLNGQNISSDSTFKQLRDLREQYNRLQEDYKNKVCEVSYLRNDIDQLKCELKQLESDKKMKDNQFLALEKKLKIVEAEKDALSGSKEQMMEQEQALTVLKHRFRESQDELQELRLNNQEQISQTEEYRNKYLQAQQIVEEQKRQLNLMEMDNARINENVTSEINRIKNQFQKKLAELAPLPEVLKDAQLKLQELQRANLLADQRNGELSKEIASLKERIQTLNIEMEVLRNENEEIQNNKSNVCEMMQQIQDLKNKNENLRNIVSEVEEIQEKLKKKIDEKMHEIAQLQAMIEQIREDSARQVARAKEKSEIMRKNLQIQISQMEEQVAQCKAITRAAQKDRDEIRQKIESQVNILSESFAQAQGRINLIKGHVNYLKDSPDIILMKQNQENSPRPTDSPQKRGYDSCNCDH